MDILKQYDSAVTVDDRNEKGDLKIRDNEPNVSPICSLWGKRRAMRRLHSYEYKVRETKERKNNYLCRADKQKSMLR